jgi:superkiller protein 3
MTDVTRILSAIEQGDPHAAEQLLPLVYDELRKLAAAKLAQEKPGQTLQPTALVHEAYLRLVGDQHFDNRGHFFAAAAEAMRPIVVETARRKKLDEAVAEYRNAIKLYPKGAGAHFALGNVLRRQKKLDEAVPEYRKAIELNPKSSGAYNGLGNSLGNQKKFDEAITAYRKAIELDPKDAIAHSNLGLALRDQGRLDEAVAAHCKAIELDPKNVQPHYNLGNCLREQGKLDQAVTAFRKAIEIDPKCAFAHISLGNALRDQGKLDEAIAEWKKSIELDPKSAVAHYDLGNALKAKGDLDGAERAYREAVRLDGKHRGAAIGALAELLLSRGNLKEAIATARESVKLAPQSSFAWQVLGWAHYRARDWKASIEALEKSCALQDNPKGGDAYQWFFQAMAHWQLGQKEKAREFHDRAVQWMDKNGPKSEQLRRFRAEASQLLELKKKK